MLQLQQSELVLSAVRSGREAAQRLVRQQQKQQRAAQSEQRAAEVQAQQEQEQQAAAERHASAPAPKVGDMVYVPKLQARAKVVKVNSTGVMTLQMGRLKMTATREELDLS